MACRKDILLRAARDILRKCEKGPYVEDVMKTTAVWDEAECDGACLLEEIEDELDFPESVEISHSEYQSLLEDRAFLECLQGAGVDNWEGYADAQEMMGEDD